MEKYGVVPDTTEKIAQATYQERLRLRQKEKEKEAQEKARQAKCPPKS